MKHENYDVSGMSCAACSSRVEKCVRGLEGVSSVSVNLLKNSMTVDYDESRLSSAGIVEAVEKAGYGAKSRSAAKMLTKDFTMSFPPDTACGRCGTFRP